MGFLIPVRRFDSFRGHQALNAEPAANPASTPTSSSGQGLRPFKPAAGIRIPLGAPRTSFRATSARALLYHPCPYRLVAKDTGPSGRGQGFEFP